MATLTLVTIPEPARGTRRIVRGGEEVEGYEESRVGTMTYLCGGCGAVLMDKVSTVRTVDLVIQCPDCGAFNETPSGSGAYE
jgi:DNA-directed RNA polymerase subunit RPC12/RpoP